MQSLNDCPDLIVNQCPLGCGNCAGVYLNQQSGHRIVCYCIKCHHKQDIEKQKGAADLGQASEKPAAASADITDVPGGKSNGTNIKRPI
jgi:hypothetical protein